MRKYYLKLNNVRSNNATSIAALFLTLIYHVHSLYNSQFYINTLFNNKEKLNNVSSRFIIILFNQSVILKFESLVKSKKFQS